VEYTVLPLENTIYGPVTETLDCFFGRFDYSGTNRGKGDGDRKGKGKEKEIIATLDLPIRHCLVVKRGTRMEDISVVSSHEQVSLPFVSLICTWS
jgi:prephenate dehydratase